jgi:hypothetical protein
MGPLGEPSLPSVFRRACPESQIVSLPNRLVEELALGGASRFEACRSRLTAELSACSLPFAVAIIPRF